MADVDANLRSKWLSGVELTQAENDQLVADVEGRGDEHYSVEALHARYVATQPAGAAAHEGAVAAWWAAHEAWCIAGCPEGGDPGPHPDEALPVPAPQPAPPVPDWQLPMYAQMQASLDADHAAKLAREASAQPTMSLTELAIQDRMQKLKVDAEARRRVKAEQQGEVRPMDLATGTELAGRADDTEKWLIADTHNAEQGMGLLHQEGLTLITAMRKVGKTTFALNMTRSLLTGEPFLDAYEVDPIEGRVAFLNFEVSAAQFGRWAVENSVPLDRLMVGSFRGRTNPLGSQQDRDELVEWMLKGGAQVMIVDPFSQAFPGESQNDTAEVQAFYALLMEMAKDAGVLNVIVSNHAGWSGDRSRGSSALEDGPDSLILLTEDQYGHRFMSARGRDVEVPKGELLYDQATRRLTLDRDGNRIMGEQVARSAALVDALVAVVTDHPGVGVRDIQDALKARGIAFGKADVAPAMDSAAAQGRIQVRAEGRGKKACYLPEGTQ